MPRFRVATRGEGSVEVEASNWLSALGEGVAQLGSHGPLDRIACEALPNGQVLVRDVRSGQGFIVQTLDADESEERVAEIEPDALPLPLPEDTADTAEVARPATLMDEVDEIMRAATDEAAIRHTLEALRALVPAEGASVIRVRSDGTLGFAAAAGPGAAALQGVSFSSSQGVAGFSVRRRAAVALSEPYADPRFFSNVDAVTGVRTRSILCVPVAFETRVFGCIEAVNSVNARGFGAEDMADAGILADALAQRLTAGGPISSR